MSGVKPHDFQEEIYRQYDRLKRDLPWRHPDPDGNFNAYKILVSEIMLQQTQVARVIPKYDAFLDAFPSVSELAGAPLSEVLRYWSGLGYNRRAKYLHDAARQLQDKQVWTLEDLTSCKGIGHNTAAAVVVYAYNQAVPFIETNVRTVYIHHFFQDQSDVHDSDIQKVLEATFDQEHPREFAWALMDYGSHLKQTVGNASRYSRHYVKQPTFEGSLRQIRGQVLKALVQQPHSPQDLHALLPDDRLSRY